MNLRDREFILSDCFIYLDTFGICKLEDIEKSFVCLSHTKVSYIIDQVKKIGYSIDWGGEYIAWDKNIFSIDLIYEFVESGFESGVDRHNKQIFKKYLNGFRAACRNSKLKEIGI